MRNKVKKEGVEIQKEIREGKDRGVGNKVLPKGKRKIKEVSRVNVMGKRMKTVL